jgi:hypothetical protein
MPLSMRLTIRTEGTGTPQEPAAIITGGTSGIDRLRHRSWRCVRRHRRARRGEARSPLHSRSFALFVAADDAKTTSSSSRQDGRGWPHRLRDQQRRRGFATGAIAETDPVDHDLAVHVRAPFLAMKFASPPMVARRSGSFIHMSSISGQRAGFNVFGYEVAKAALAHLTRCAALELGEKGVRVNCISPGPTRTGIFAKAGGLDPDMADQRVNGVGAAFANLLPAVLPMRHGQADDRPRGGVLAPMPRFITGRPRRRRHRWQAGGDIKAGWESRRGPQKSVPALTTRVAPANQC